MKKLRNVCRKLSRMSISACALFAAVVCLNVPAATAENRYHAALLSITASELHEHVATLADDIYEGRMAGSRGGRAAANYIVQELRRYELAPAGSDNSFFQPCSRGYRNILALRKGSDPLLAEEVILVSAHYDHVGYGTPRTSFGPIGHIHNGADDNASGVSALLETIQALDAAEIATRRSILFAFWDGEEIGLIGSKHWAGQPTLPLSRVQLMLNVDMVGWLREGRLELVGTRTGYGMRRLLSSDTLQPMWLDFSWELDSNSDHWPFVQREIPVAMLHTGLHDHYHRPSDDVERINHEGLQHVSRYLFDVILKTANVEELPKFRSVAHRENEESQRRFERPATPAPPRIGISWRAVAADDPTTESIPTAAKGVIVLQVDPGSPAARGGLLPGDHIVAYDDAPLTDSAEFHQTLLRAESKVSLSVLRRANDADAEPQPLQIIVEPAGEPVRLGISWRADEAEPQSVVVTRVVPGSPAEVAGIKFLDRICEIDHATFRSQEDFSALVRGRLAAAVSELNLLVESKGHVREVTVKLAPSRIALLAP